MATADKKMQEATREAHVSSGVLGWEDALKWIKELKAEIANVELTRDAYTKNRVNWEKVERLKLEKELADTELTHVKTMLGLQAKLDESVTKKRRRARLALIEEEAKKELAQLEKRAREEAAIKLKYEKAIHNTKDKFAKELLKKELKREEERAKRNRESDAALPRMAANGAVAKAGLNEGVTQLGNIFKALKSGDKEGAGNALAAAGDSFNAVGDALKDTLNLAGKEFGDALKDKTGLMMKNLSNAGALAVNSAMNLLTGRQSKIVARLQESGEFFTVINEKMQTILAASPFVKYTDMLTKVEELVDKGVAYNVELRAFLASISDKIANTFDAFDSNLLLIIRIQQEDSTKQRLGMEASLTKFLNSRYQDTSYLSGVHDEVTKALTASIVQLGTAKGAEFEFAAQKWFGSLSALGMDDATITGLAGAINALSTGDVEALASSPYLNLLVMAANQSGMSYADILTLGLNAESVNSLLSNIVAYWSSIADAGNQVVKKKYAEIFGLSMTDMTAIKNVTLKDMDKIFNKDLSYGGMRAELALQVALIPLRMAMSEMMNNVWDNVKTGIGMNIASNPGSAAVWLVNDFIKGATGGINIPSISTMFAGLDLEANVNDLIQLGMVGISTLGQIGRVVGGLAGLGGLNLTMWGALNTTRHGAGLGSAIKGVTASTSQTTFIGNSDSSGIYLSTLNKAYSTEEITEVLSKALTQEEKEDAKLEHIKNIDTNVLHIYDLLSSVISGSNAIHVTMSNFGLSLPF